MPSGYVRLSEVPEVQTALNRVADLLSTMTIHLMQNTVQGDARIVNELSRKLDIAPNRYLTRKSWMFNIVRNMLVYGSAYQMISIDAATGNIEDFIPVRNDIVTVIDDPMGYGCSYLIAGKPYAYDEIVTFVYNPDDRRPWTGVGLTHNLKVIADQLAQARKTSRAIMGQPAPSIIVKVDGLTEEFASVEGRKILRAQYLDSSEAGEPWFIPADMFEVEQVKPLSLNDLAITTSMEIDKRTIAAVVGVPSFFVGVGTFDADEYNNFIRTIVLPIARLIEQTLTAAIIRSPKMFIRMNYRSLYAYSLTELAEVDCKLVDRAIIDRNEARDDMGRTPREGLDELAALENYIPFSQIGDQKKLGKGGGSSDKN